MCGGGGNTPPPAGQESGAQGAQAVCVSLAWVDSAGDDCSAYAQFPQWCGYEESKLKCCACGGGDTYVMRPSVNILLTSSSLRINKRQVWPEQALAPPPASPVSSTRPWLTISNFPILERCRSERVAGCPWDACDNGMQQVLEASCQGPFGSAPQCWAQPYPVRYRMELVSMRLKAETSCYQVSACIAPLTIVRRNSTAAAGASFAKELVTGEEAHSVWYWTAPSDWFVGNSEAGRLLGRLLQLRLATHVVMSQPEVEGAGEEGLSEDAARARRLGHDLVFYHSDGQAVARSLDVMPVADMHRTFDYWIPCEFESGKWWKVESGEARGAPSAQHHPPSTSSPKGEAATQEEVEHVLQSVHWLFVRGVYQAVFVSGSYTDVEAVGELGNGVGVVHVVRTVLRGAGVVDVPAGAARLRLLSATPMSGSLLLFPPPPSLPPLFLEEWSYNVYAATAYLV